MVEAGISPREFDGQLEASGIKTTTFIFGFGGLSPCSMDYVSRRVVEDFNAHLNRYQGAVAFTRHLAGEYEDLFVSLAADYAWPV